MDQEILIVELLHGSEPIQPRYKNLLVTYSNLFMATEDQRSPLTLILGIALALAMALALALAMAMPMPMAKFCFVLFRHFLLFVNIITFENIS